MLATGNGQQMPTSEYQFIRFQQDSQRSLGQIAEDFHAMNKAREYDVYSGRYDVCSDRDEMGPCTRDFNKKMASLLEETLEHKDSNKPLHQVVDSQEEGNLIRGIAMAAYYMYSPLQTTDDPRSLDVLNRRIHNSGIRDCFYDATKSYYHQIDERFVVNVHNVKEAGNFELKGIRFNDIKKFMLKSVLILNIISRYKI